MKRKNFLTFVTLCVAALFVSLSFIRSNDISYAHSLLLTESGENVSYSANAYHIDCQASSNGNGSVTMPWNNLNEINSHTFLPADQILLKRGTVCAGNLDLKGSGSEGNPIVLSSYGDGDRPVIKTTAAVQAAIRLFNEEYWTIEHIETTGGNQYGIYVGGDVSNRVLHNIRINDVFVHNVNGSPRWDSGLIVVAPNGEHLTFENVVIENSVVNNFENSTQGNAWWGIHVGFNPTYGNQHLSDRSRSVTVRNCNVQNTYGDSITFALVNDGLIESNVSKRSGLAPSGISYTPNAIWTWDSDNVVIQFNEGSEAYSHGVDGGIFDADHGSTNITFQYNYGHHAQGYCLGIFAANGKPTSNIVFRYNICAGNDRGGSGSGEIEFWSWNGGYFDGIQIYNNVLLRNSGNSNKPIIWGEHIDLGGSRPNIVFNNIISSNSPRMIQFAAPFTLKNNIYWYSGAGNAEWIYGNNSPSYSLQEHQANSGQDQGSVFANPLLPNIYHIGGINSAAAAFLPAAESPAYNNGINALPDMGVRDFAGTTVPQDNIYDIGAMERVAEIPQPTPTLTPTPTPSPTPSPTPTPNPTPSPSPTTTPTPNATPTPSPSPTPMNDYTLIASPGNVKVGRRVTVSWTAPSESSRVDWIALFRVGAPNTDYGWRQYTNGAASGSFTVTMPMQTGQYEFRYLLNDGYHSVKTSNTIRVKR